MHRWSKKHKKNLDSVIRYFQIIKNLLPNQSKIYYQPAINAFTKTVGLHTLNDPSISVSVSNLLFSAYLQKISMIRFQNISRMLEETGWDHCDRRIETLICLRPIPTEASRRVIKEMYPSLLALMGIITRCISNVLYFQVIEVRGLVLVEVGQVLEGVGQIITSAIMPQSNCSCNPGIDLHKSFLNLNHFLGPNL